MKEKKIKLCQPNIDIRKYRKSYVCSIIISHDEKIILQYRDDSFKNFPNILTILGGQMEENETPQDALIQELAEELNAKVDFNSPRLLGLFTEDATEHQDLIYTFFWHDNAGTISGCNEGEVRYFDRAEDILAQPNILDGDRWMFYESRNREFI